VAKKSTTTRSESSQVDVRMAKAARGKIYLGKTPSRAEMAALRRVEREEDEESRWRHYAEIPKRHWREMAGRTTQQLHRHAEQFGIPVRGRYIDLGAVVSWLHNFLTENSAVFEGDDALTAGPKTESLERLRKAQAEKVEMQNRVTRGELRRADDVRRCFGVIAGTLRQASSALNVEFGRAAYQVMADAIQKADDTLAKFERQVVDGSSIEAEATED
jgi:phage terminase Nu1 subunit (DNA packaging protein)